MKTAEMIVKKHRLERAEITIGNFLDVPSSDRVLNIIVNIEAGSNIAKVLRKKWL